MKVGITLHEGYVMLMVHVDGNILSRTIPTDSEKKVSTVQLKDLEDTIEKLKQGIALLKDD